MSNYKGTFTPGAENNNWNIAFDYINQGSKVLDVGCSTGNFGEALKFFKKCQVDGIEPEPGDYRIATSKLDNVYMGKLENLMDGPLAGHEYDYVVFMDVIEHLVNPVDTLKDTKALLSDNGSIIFSIPNMSHISVRLMLMGGDFEYGKTGILDNTHLHFYTEKEINRVFNEAQYEITDLKPMIVGYSEEIISSELRKRGVHTVDSGLVKLLGGSNSHVYQYVGKAIPTKNPNYKAVDRKFQSPQAKKIFELQYEKRLSKISTKLEALSEENKLLSRKNTELNTKNTALKKQLEQILNSRSIRFINIIKKAVGR